jgi:predicted Zn-dependent protease
MYKRGAYAEAAPLLKSSASQLPDSPSIQYHLGMTAHQLGDTAVARLALTKAVASGSNFAGREDARRALAQLK